MPYQTEHAAWLKAPGKYASFRRENDKFGAGIHPIFGVTDAGKAELQAIRFDKGRFTVSQAQKWLREHQHEPMLFEPAASGSAKTSAALLCAETLLSPVGHETMQDGMPVKRFRKDLITEGVYRHPSAGWTLDVDEARMQRWIAAFRAMTNGGHQVPVPAGHSYDPRDGLGMVVDMEIERDSDGKAVLVAVMEMIGDEAISTAYRTRRVSISVNPEFVDGKGRNFGEVIEHVAVTGYPVVPGQQDFRAIAASLVSTDDGGETMDKPTLDKLQAMYGISEELTDENWLDKITEAQKALSEASAAAKTQASELKTKLDDMGKELEQAKQASGGTKPPEVSDEVQDVLAEAAEAKAASLVETGKITPAVKDKLCAALVGAAGKRNVFALSRHVSKTDASLANAVLDALKENDVVKLGEKTGLQVLQASTAQGDATEADAAEIKRRAESVSS